MLVVAYIVSAALEIVGIALVVLDVRADRAQARQLVTRQRPNYLPRSQPRHWTDVQMDERAIRRSPGDFQAASAYRRRAEEARDLQRIARGSAEAEAELLQAVADMLHGSIFRRLRGPLLVALGVFIGTVANIAASG